MRPLLLTASIVLSCALLTHCAARQPGANEEPIGKTSSGSAPEAEPAHVASVAQTMTSVAHSEAQKNMSPGQKTTMASVPIQCTVDGKGITYSVEKCNETSKTIIKVAVRDSYTATVPSGERPTRAPVPEPTEAAKESSSKEAFSGYSDDYNYDMGIQDYEPLFPPHSPNAQAAREFSREETRRRVPFRPPTTTTTTTTTWTPPFRRGMFGLYGSARRGQWFHYCEEAKKDDDDEVFRVPDGSFNPTYEAVVGLGFYRLHAKPRTWEQARRTCEREGAHLAILNSREEADALKDIHNRCHGLLTSHFDDYQYLGVHDMHGEGNWITVFGEKLNDTGYVSWARNQPDNAHHFGENCLTMNRWGAFNDVPCSTEIPFICEHL